MMVVHSYKLWKCSIQQPTSNNIYWLLTVFLSEIVYRWNYVAPMNAQRSRVALTANMGKLWAVGGYDGISNLVTVEVYDPKTDVWTYASDMIAHEGGVGLGVISI